MTEPGITAAGPQGIYVLHVPVGAFLSQDEKAEMVSEFSAAIERGRMVVGYGATVEWVGPGPKPRPSVWQRLRARFGR